MSSKERRNISIDGELNDWLDGVDNASKLVSELLRAYRSYGGDEMEAVRFVLEKRVHDTAEEL